MACGVEVLFYPLSVGFAQPFHRVLVPELNSILLASNGKPAGAGAPSVPLAKQCF